MSEWNRHHTFAAAALVLLFIALLDFSASGVRGSDQYWYADDVETLLEGGNTSNQSFTRTALESPAPQSRPPFVHNNLGLYLTLPLAFILGSFQGWVWTNGVATILLSLIVGGIVYRLRPSGPLALLTFALCLLNPLAFWQASQPLLEATFMPFVGAAAWVYLFQPRGPARYVLLWFLLATLFLARSSFLPILLLVPVVLLWESPPAERFSPRNLGLMVTSLALALVMPSIAGAFFVQSMPHDFGSVLMNGGPGGSNMDFMLRAFQPELTVAPLVDKFFHSLKLQFLQMNKTLLFYLPFNVGLVIGLASLKQRDPATRRLQVVAIILTGLHFLTGAIHQNQFRYLLVPYPFVLANAILHVSGRQRLDRWLRPMGVLVLVACIGGSSLLARKLHVEGLQHKQEIQAIRSQVDSHLGAHERVVMCQHEKGSQWVHAMRPRVVTTVHAQIGDADLDRVLERVQPHWLLCGAAGVEASAEAFHAKATVELTSRKGPTKLIRLHQ